MKKGDLLKDLELKQEEVKLPSGTVIARELPGIEYARTFNDPLAKGEKDELDGVKFTALLVTRSIVGEDGERIFADEDAADLPKKGRFYSTLCAAVNRVNGMTGEEGNV